MSVDHEGLINALSRLTLTAIRDQLDSLLTRGVNSGCRRLTVAHRGNPRDNAASRREGRRARGSNWAGRALLGLRSGSPLLTGCCLYGAVVSIPARYPE